ncbi:hypothetical protein [Sphingomonas xinjiangensis]|uniref:Uncharacterized protein n=1 Tax=Sphingomonas xinjiangensis TaxID=643568 RepID=A0A840YRU8_9SPHN|nr:hypothetical protein [Sphingomonas xinjiangensis]MBB5712404.1 hypothetical protein [Sphingomonas xinjiangensis]
MLGYKFAQLASIDPNRPLAQDMHNQTLSLFGREDLISRTSPDYKSNYCGTLANSGDVFSEIVSRARRTSIVVINESHQRSEHRGFTAEVAKRLRPLGYDILALETLSNPSPGIPAQYLPSFLKQPSLPYLIDEDGFYLSEAGFGRLGRLAKALGYRLTPYEYNDEGRSRSLPVAEQIALREEGQANSLAAFLRSNPAAKLLIHVGYSHAGEVAQSDGSRWMAARLKEKTGIDPLTISQTTCRGGHDRLGLSVPPAGEPAGMFDLIVDHPEPHFERHRPKWRTWLGDQAVSIPKALRPAVGWRVIEARPVSETSVSVPMDRVAIRPGEDVALMLPPGRYKLRIIDVVALKKTS